MAHRQLSMLDKLLDQIDSGLRTSFGNAPTPNRASPAQSLDESELNDQQRQHAIGLMRVNHAGEICAQALYQGQALTAKLPEVGDKMRESAEEEIDHLAWCEQRIYELGGTTSALNPAWYAMSFALGAGAGLVSDKLSLGFVAATEDQVCSHLEKHLDELPIEDNKSRSIVEQMLVDEAHHAESALAAGGHRFPKPVKALMKLVSSAMTKSSYKI
jgi:ubiquinone biosynthesis monooxygenase Coq7